MRPTPLVICSLAVATLASAQSYSPDFVKEASRDFERQADQDAQALQNAIVAERLRRLEMQKAAEVEAQQAAEAKHAAWLRKADTAFNASWYKIRRTLTRQYPDLSHPESTMFLLFQRTAQSMRDQENPILLDAIAPRLIAENAARQLGIVALPPPAD
jgi:hypothetical protein